MGKIPFLIVFLSCLMISIASLISITDTGYSLEASQFSQRNADDLAIETARLKDYDSGSLSIESELESGPNFRRFKVSYLSDGLKVYALLTIPMEERPDDGWPAIIVNHGDLPPEEYQTGLFYTDHYSYFAERNFVVLMPDYRGHGDSEGIALSAYAVPDYTNDILSALHALKLNKNVNPDQIGMWAHSTGAHMTLRAMVISPDIKAGVMWGGVVGSYEELIRYYPTYWEQTNTPPPKQDPDNPKYDWRSFLLKKYGTFSEHRNAWDHISATHYLHDISGPLQLHHSADDEWVPFMLSERLYTKLKSKRLNAELFTYHSDNHNLDGNFETAMQRSIEFFNDNLITP